MKQITVPSGEYLLVEVPEGSANPGYMFGTLTVDIKKEDGKVMHKWLVDAEDWMRSNWKGGVEVVGIASYLSEDEWKGIIPFHFGESGKYDAGYWDYENTDDRWAVNAKNVTDSGHSLIASHSMKPSECLILKKIESEI